MAKIAKGGTVSFLPREADASLLTHAAELSSSPGPGNVQLEFKPQSFLDLVGRQG